ARLPARSDGAAGDDGAVLESELGERAGVRIRDLRHGGWIQKKPPNGRLRRGRRGGRDRGSRLGCEAGCDRASGGDERVPIRTRGAGTPETGFGRENYGSAGAGARRRGRLHNTLARAPRSALSPAPS